MLARRAILAINIKSYCQLCDKKLEFKIMLKNWFTLGELNIWKTKHFDELDYRGGTALDGD